MERSGPVWDKDAGFGPFIQLQAVIQRSVRVLVTSVGNCGGWKLLHLHKTGVESELLVSEMQPK